MLQVYAAFANWEPRRFGGGENRFVIKVALLRLCSAPPTLSILNRRKFVRCLASLLDTNLAKIGVTEI
jgi:hypothetical protein